MNFKNIRTLICSNKLFRNGFLFSFFSFLNSGINFLLLIILAKFISSADYGVLNLFNISLTLIGIFISLNTTGLFSVEYFNYPQATISKIIGNTFFITSCVFLFLNITLLIFPSLYVKYTGIPLNFLFIGLAICYFQVFSNVLLDIWRLEEKVILYGVFSCITVFFNFLITLLLIIHYKFSWEGRVYAQIGVCVCSFVFSIVVLVRKKYLRKFSLDRKYIKELLAFGIPLIPHSISTWFRQGVDRYIINAYFPLAMVGVFSLSFNVANIIHIVGFAFNATNSVYIYKLLSENRENASSILLKQTWQMIYFFIGFTIIVITASHFFFPIFFPQYEVSLKYLFPLGISAMFQCIYYLFVNYLFYFKRTKWLMYITFSVSLCHLVLSLILTRYSVLYTAYITLFSNFLITLLVIIYSQKLFSINFFYWKSK